VNAKNVFSDCLNLKANRLTCTAENRLLKKKLATAMTAEIKLPWTAMKTKSNAAMKVTSRLDNERTCGLSNSLQQNSLSNAKLNGLVRGRKSIETQVDTVQEIVWTQRNHRPEQVAKYLARLQPDNAQTHTHNHSDLV